MQQSAILLEHEQQVNNRLFYVFSLASIAFFPLTVLLLHVPVTKSASILLGVVAALLARLLSKENTNTFRNIFIYCLCPLSSPQYSLFWIKPIAE